MSDYYEKINIKARKLTNKNTIDKKDNLTGKNKLDYESQMLRQSKEDKILNLSQFNRNMYSNKNNEKEKLNNPFNNTWNFKNENQLGYLNENVNNVNIMEIKLNHQMLENKIENMRQTLFKENKNLSKENFKTNYIETQKTEIFNKDNDKKKLFKNINYQHNVPLSSNDKSNQINNKGDKFHAYRHNLTDSHEENLNSNPAQSLENWNNQIGNIIPSKVNILDDIDMKQNLNKTLGNLNYYFDPITDNFTSSNGFRSVYQRKELAELDTKIELSKNRLNECLKKTENFIIDRKIERKPYHVQTMGNNNMFSKNNRIDDYIQFIKKQGMY